MCHPERSSGFFLSFPQGTPAAQSRDLLFRFQGRRFKGFETVPLVHEKILG
jgi:hypothetical protein